MTALFTVESEPDKGTTFKIIFPALTSDKPSQKVEEQPQQSPHGTETILFVDDEKSILETGKETLISYGYKVVTAESGEQALEVYCAQKDEINLVIMDLIMPGKGGKKCLIDLLAINNNAKVLMTSGYANTQQTEDLTKAGAAGLSTNHIIRMNCFLALEGFLIVLHHYNGFSPLQSSNGV